MIWSTDESTIKIGKDQIDFEGGVCHAKEFGFFSGDIEGPFKETTYRMNWYAKTEKRDP